MDLYGVQQYRFAAWQERWIDTLAPTPLLSHSLRGDRAFGMEAEFAFGGIAALVVRAISPLMIPDGVPRTTQYDDAVASLARVNAPMVSAWATRLLFLFDELTILHRGASSAYYPEDSSRTALNAIGEQFHALGPYVTFVSDLLEALPRNHRRLSSRGAYRRRLDLPHVEIGWYEAKTPEFFECVRLLVFAGELEWDNRSAQLAGLSSRLAANLSLELDSDEVDRLAWGLSGAESLYGIAGLSGITWSTTFAVVDGLRQYEEGRVSQLDRIRASIAATASNVSTNEISTAVKRLTQTLQPNASDREDYPY